MEVTFDMIRSSPEIRTYITQADASLTALGFTEHSFAHVGKCAHVAAQILTELGYTPREVELAQIAAYMHDIGNVVNRHDHAISGATTVSYTHLKVQILTFFKVRLKCSLD